MDERVVGVARRRRSRAEAAALLAEYEASGLSRVEFCAQHVLAVGTLDRYRKQRQQLRGAAAEPARWVAVDVSASGPAGVLDSTPAGVTAPGQAGALGRASGLAVVRRPGRRIELEHGFDAATVVLANSDVTDTLRVAILTSIPVLARVFGALRDSPGVIQEPCGASA